MPAAASPTSPAKNPSILLPKKSRVSKPTPSAPVPAVSPTKPLLMVNVIPLCLPRFFKLVVILSLPLRLPKLNLSTPCMNPSLPPNLWKFTASLPPKPAFLVKFWLVFTTLKLSSIPRNPLYPVDPLVLPNLTLAARFLKPSKKPLFGPATILPARLAAKLGTLNN